MKFVFFYIVICDIIGIQTEIENAKYSKIKLWDIFLKMSIKLYTVIYTILEYKLKWKMAKYSTPKL